MVLKFRYRLKRDGHSEDLALAIDVDHKYDQLLRPVTENISCVDFRPDSRRDYYNLMAISGPGRSDEPSFYRFKSK